MARFLDDIEEGVLGLHKLLGKLRSRIGTVVAPKRDLLDEKVRVRRITKTIETDIELVEAMLRDRLKHTRRKPTKTQGIQTDVRSPELKRPVTRATSLSPSRRVATLQPAWCSAVNNNRKSTPIRRKESPRPHLRAATTSCKLVQVTVTCEHIATQTSDMVDTPSKISASASPPLIPLIPGFHNLPIDCLFEIIDFLHIDPSFLDLLRLSKCVSRTAMRVLEAKKHLLVDNSSTWNLLKSGKLCTNLESTMLHVDTGTVDIAEKFMKTELVVENLKFLQLVPKGIHAGELPYMGVQKLLKLRWLDTQLDVMECKHSFFENFPKLEGCFMRRFSTPINSLTIPKGHPLSTLLYGFNNPLSNSDCDVILPAQVRALGIFESADILPVSNTLQIVACRLHAAIDLLDTLPEACPNLRYLVILKPQAMTGSTKHLLDVINSYQQEVVRQINIIRATECSLLKVVCRLLDELVPE
eukprot:TRINITY_DN15060_c0_g1_i1.p1 TRINITY_DN15060_c0_g1~~TRINITY_DN15060_c0_g1_i1.p1  ORF type:complete len:491 (+),score=74.66 TRINITY_DN15060_c0_g1_i1:66-1475(+)